MEITFLGTASGTPTKTRNVSAIALKDSQGSHWHLIDCGEGTQHQLLKTHHSIETMQQEAQASYSGKLYMANDFDCFTVDKQGQTHIKNNT